MLLSNVDNKQFDCLKEIIRTCNERVVIVSPYLAAEFESFLDLFDFSSTIQVDLVTTFKPKNIEQITKPFQIRSYFRHFSSKYPQIQPRVFVDNRLHGKLYFSLGEQRSLILTSGNFTNNGMSSNNEWGVLITDEENIEQALEEVFEGIEYHDVTPYQIDRACLFAETYLGNNPDWKVKPDVPADILESVYSDTDTNNDEVKYFLKPIGHSESPITLKEKRDFSELHQNLHFSKKKPKGVRKGDVMITTAVGAGSLLSYFKVTSGLQYASEKQIRETKWMERWPWFVEGRNNSTKFGSAWWQHNLRRQDLLKEFQGNYPTEPVTAAGGMTLGTINMGNDKVQLSKRFGEFLITKIRDAETEDLQYE